MSLYTRLTNRIRRRPSAGNDAVDFTCNICGRFNTTSLDMLAREVPSCRKCGSTVRMRAIVHVLSMGLFNESKLLKDFPERKDLKGIGMSDWDRYASILSRKLDYTNTFYHQAPRLDITDVDEEMCGTLDFIISSDVYEHVLYPVSRAFDNTKRLLKENGVFVFTVPYTKEGETTVEHFGQLHDYKILEQSGEYVLVDTDDSGNQIVYENLVFHGGPGSTLEMRVFSEASLLHELQRAGFRDITIHREPCLEFGIHWGVDWSLPISARN